MLGFIEILGSGQLKPEFETKKAYFDSIFQQNTRAGLKRLGVQQHLDRLARRLNPALVFLKSQKTGPSDPAVRPTKPTNTKK